MRRFVVAVGVVLALAACGLSAFATVSVSERGTTVSCGQVFDAGNHEAAAADAQNEMTHTMSSYVRQTSYGKSATTKRLSSGSL
jgi:hypothetical protein